MEPPKEPSKPGFEEADAALAASAANAVEQWRTYQNAYTLYQQQQAAYEMYMEKQVTLTSYAEKQAAYQQYLLAHDSYQKQLEQYEQNKAYQEYYATTNGFPVTTSFQSVPPMTIPPLFTTPLANVDPFYNNANDHYRDPKTLKRRSDGSEKRSKAYTTTNYYANPDDEQLFPAELKQLFKELECGLCVCKMNSHISANVHYQSKVHEKKVTQWLNEWCETTGTPKVQRPKRKQFPVEPVGSNSLRCEACDLPLTSVQHANQHYTGKRHMMVVRGMKNPTGKGFFNRDGHWTRTLAGATDENPERFGIGQTFAKNRTRYSVNDAKRLKWQDPPPTNSGLTFVGEQATIPPATPLYETPATPIYSAPTVAPPLSVYPLKPVTKVYGQIPPVMSQLPPGLQPSATADVNSVASEVMHKESTDCVDASGVFCLVCQIGVTSKTVMETHLKGSKHLKKLKLCGRMQPPTEGDTTGTVETILDSLRKPPQQNDWSLYRMPSGKYYCQTCNSIIADEKMFSQHWYGKRHKLKAKQEMDEVNGSAAKKPKFFNRRPFGKGRTVQPESQ